MKILIVGAGLSGCTAARLFADKHAVTIIDKRSHIGGNCYDYRDPASKVTIHKYGPHIFHTLSSRVFEFLCRFTVFNDYTHRVTAIIDNAEVPLPFSFLSLDKIFPAAQVERFKKKLLKKYPLNTRVSVLSLLNNSDSELQELGCYVFDNVFKNYTRKQWGIPAEELDRSVLDRVPVYIGECDRYFPDAQYEGIPAQGYTAMFECMLEHENIELRLNTPYAILEDKDKYDLIIYTGSIDEFYLYRFGRLQYRSIKQEYRTLEQEYYRSQAVINYPNDYAYTRIVEHKYFLGEVSEKTVISYEYPCVYESGKNEPYYPITNPENTALYTKYKVLSRDVGNIVFMGRLGDYRYYDMDKAVLRAFEVYERYVENM